MILYQIFWFMVNKVAQIIYIYIFYIRKYFALSVMKGFQNILSKTCEI